MGISNRPDPMEQERERKMQNPLNLDPITQHALELHSELREKRAKYESLVKNLGDMDFAALFQIVMEERERRMVRLMLENPVLLQMQLEQLRQQAKDQEN